MTTGNNVVLVGNVTRDPELRVTPTGLSTATFGLAVNRRWQNRQTQEWEEAVSYFDIVAWRELAHNVGESLSKGMRIVVTGRLEQRSWETAEGEKRSKIEVIADEIGPSLRWATVQVIKNERSFSSDEPASFSSENTVRNMPENTGGYSLAPKDAPAIAVSDMAHREAVPTDPAYSFNDDEF
ncbi:MAG: single-stranded DNA-binding protein [Actinobacteria bacterium]|nr:single-stranded DNA-binding protein [Actinomycetota bacterium]MCL6104264.1 single-stranded DNA-binding protein [Actinomycetota bacterium]